MATNDEILQQIQEEILVSELIEQTKSYGLIWKQTSPTQFKVTEIDRSQCNDPFYPNASWNAIVSKMLIGENYLYVLDISRNTIAEIGIDSEKVDKVATLYSIIERANTDPTAKTKKAIRFYQQLNNAYNAVSGPPFTLRPNADLDDGWLRVPATGMYFDKIWQPVDTHDGDSTYIYDTSMTIAKFGFDPLPDWAPDSYDSVVLRMAVKNIQGTQIIGVLLVIEENDVVSDSEVFTDALTVGSYVVTEMTWTRSFTRQEINNLHVQLGAIASVNRISAIELVVN